MENARKIRKFLNFGFSKISLKVEIPVRRRREEIKDKTIFKHEKVRETRISRIKREEPIQGSSQKRIELPQPKNNLTKGRKEGSTSTIPEDNNERNN